MQNRMHDRGLSGRTLGAAVLVMTVIVAVAAAFTRASQSSASSAASSVAVPPAAPSGPSMGAGAPSEASSVPLVAVDSLPVALRGAMPKGSGRLSVAASPGWCSISVDGIARGVTPVASLELPAGAHRLDCVPPAGKPHAVSVNIAEGVLTRHKFALEE